MTEHEIVTVNELLFELYKFRSEAYGELIEAVRKYMQPRFDAMHLPPDLPTRDARINSLFDATVRTIGLIVLEEIDDDLIEALENDRARREEVDMDDG